MYIIGNVAVLVKDVDNPLNIDTFYIKAYMLFIQLNQAYYHNHLYIQVYKYSFFLPIVLYIYSPHCIQSPS